MLSFVREMVDADKVGDSCSYAAYSWRSLEQLARIKNTPLTFNERIHDPFSLDLVDVQNNLGVEGFTLAVGSIVASLDPRGLQVLSAHAARLL
jgi:hypothetical protein